MHNSIDDTPPIRIPLNALYRCGSRVLAYRGRAGDRLRQHLFVDDENVPEHMTDKEFVGRLTEEVLVPVTPEQLKREADERPPKRLSLANSEDVAEMARRRDYVRAWTSAGRPSRTRANLTALVQKVVVRTGDEKAPGWRTLARWLHAWLEWSEDDEALLPGKGGNRTDRFDGKARSLLADTVVENYCVDTRPTAIAVHRSVTAAFDDANACLPEGERLSVPSYQAVLDEIGTIDRFTLEFTRVGKRSAEHKFRVVGAGPVVLRHNQSWEMDHTTVDAIVIDGEMSMPIGRARLSACLDRATRCCTSLTMGFEPPSAEVALECLAVGVAPKEKLLSTVANIGTWPCFGVPDEIITDHGADFRSAAFKECCRIIGSDVEHSPVLKAWYRGRIERFFRTLSREVFHRVPGTTFSSFFLRNKEAIPEMVAVCTLDELWEWSLRFIVDIYNRKPHRALGGKSPLQLYYESIRIHGMKPPPSPERVRLARSLPTMRTLQRYGVEVNSLIYQSPELLSLWVRQDCPVKVKVLVSPEDITQIRVINPFTGKEITVPIRPDLASMVQGVSLRKHKLARALQRENPERLAGIEGIKRCYRMLDAAMAAKRRRGGIRNATEAARYYEALTRVRPTDEPAVVDAVASGRSFVDDIMDDDGVFETTPRASGEQDTSQDGAVLETNDNGAMEHSPQPGKTPEPAPKKARCRRGKLADPAPDVGAGATGDVSDDLDGLVSALGLRVSQRG